MGGLQAHLNLSSDAHGATVYLSRIDLASAWLSDSNLTDVDLSYSDLSDSVLQSSWLCGTNLTGTDMSGTDLSGAKMIGAILVNTDLTNADLQGADLRHVTLISKTSDGIEKLNDCDTIKKARNWERSYRSKDLECGKEIIPDAEITDVIESCRFLEIPDHLR